MNLIPYEEITPLTPHMFHVLVALTERPMYGYGIVEQCQIDMTGSFTISIKSIYRILHNLRRFGLITTVGATPTPSGQSPNAKQFYALTNTGWLVLESEIRHYTAAAMLGQRRLANQHKRFMLRETTFVHGG